MNAISVIAEPELFALVDGIRYLDLSDVKGSVAEFGCLYGRSAQVIASALSHSPQGRDLWLFDSFKGLPDATDPVDRESPHVVSGAWKWTIDGSPETVASLCAGSIPRERIHVVPGWYNDTISNLNEKLAFVHIDCDLYESTFTVLSYLFRNHLLSDGCAMFFDDWYCNRGNPKFGEQRAWAQVPKHGYTITDWGAYGIVGRKFIVHEVE